MTGQAFTKNVVCFSFERYISVNGQNFVLTGGTGAYLVGSAVVSAPFVLGLDPVSAQDAVNAAPPGGSGVNNTFANNSATPIDRVLFDLGMLAVPPGIGSNVLAFGTWIGGFAKNGALYITFTGTTPVTIDFTNLGASVGVTSSQAGDTLLTTFNCLIVKNISSVTSTITIAPGGSNPVINPNVLAGTTPTIALAPGDVHCEYSALGSAVGSSHKTMLFTPTAAGTLVIAYGGA
jgi:hypothetical protein